MQTRPAGQAKGIPAIGIGRRGEQSPASTDGHADHHPCQAWLDGALQTVSIEVIKDGAIDRRHAGIPGVAKLHIVALAQQSDGNVHLVGRRGAIAGWVCLFQSVHTRLCDRKSKGAGDQAVAARGDGRTTIHRDDGPGESQLTKVLPSIAIHVVKDQAIDDGYPVRHVIAVAKVIARKDACPGRLDDDALWRGRIKASAWPGRGDLGVGSWHYCELVVACRVRLHDVRVTVACFQDNRDPG